MRIIDFCKNVSFQFSLLELLVSLFTIIVIIVLVLVVKMLALALKKQRIIDLRLKETRERISKIITELEPYKDRTSEVIKVDGTTKTIPKDTEQLIEHIIPNTLGDEETPCIQEVSEAPQKGKKTRAMSMEERWAEYDKKRSMKSTASRQLLY